MMCAVAEWRGERNSLCHTITVFTFLFINRLINCSKTSNCFVVVVRDQNLIQTPSGYASGKRKLRMSSWKIRLTVTHHFDSRESIYPAIQRFLPLSFQRNVSPTWQIHSGYLNKHAASALIISWPYSDSILSLVSDVLPTLCKVFRFIFPWSVKYDI